MRKIGVRERGEGCRYCFSVKLFVMVSRFEHYLGARSRLPSLETAMLLRSLSHSIS
jgi:hypothetical protein